MFFHLIVLYVLVLYPYTQDLHNTITSVFFFLNKHKLPVMLQLIVINFFTRFKPKLYTISIFK